MRLTFSFRFFRWDADSRGTGPAGEKARHLCFRWDFVIEEIIRKRQKPQEPFEREAGEYADVFKDLIIVALWIVAKGGVRSGHHRGHHRFAWIRQQAGADIQGKFGAGDRNGRKSELVIGDVIRDFFRCVEKESSQIASCDVGIFQKHIGKGIQREVGLDDLSASFFVDHERDMKQLIDRCTERR